MEDDQEALQKVFWKKVEVPKEEEKNVEEVQILRMLYLQPTRTFCKELSKRS